LLPLKTTADLRPEDGKQPLNVASTQLQKRFEVKKLMIFPNNGFLSRHIIADSQTKRLNTPAYYTHLKLSCQPLRESASHITVLSIIPLI
jgi:hypothetical protein